MKVQKMQHRSGQILYDSHFILSLTIQLNGSITPFLINSYRISQIQLYYYFGNFLH